MSKKFICILLVFVMKAGSVFVNADVIDEPLAGNAEKIEFKLTGNVLNEVSPKLFGQFLEKASWGEYGPEKSLVPGTRQLQPEVFKLIDDMNIPIIRFPGGTDVDYMDWTDTIDNVPGRQGERPTSHNSNFNTYITNEFGTDEFLRMCEQLKTEPIMVLNLRDGLAKLKSLDEAAMAAAGMVAYCNAPVGAKLPDGMVDWPSIRAKNGHSEPYNVKYFQLGNEVFAFMKKAMAGIGLSGDVEIADWYIKCLNKYIDTMKLVDPDIEIIIDAKLGIPSVNDLVLSNNRLSRKIAYVDFHIYRPWEFKKVERDGKEYPIETLTDEEMWNIWVATPGIDQSGNSVISEGNFRQYNQPWKVVCLEWNWNGWNSSGKEIALGGNSYYAMGVGAAGFLNALMRQGDIIKMATQSNLIGTSWPIGAIRVDENGKESPYYAPSGLVTSLYSNHHGNKNIEMEVNNMPFYEQPYQLGSIQPYPSVL